VVGQGQVVHIRELIDIFSEIEDRRVQGRCKHLLINVVVITICSVICGANGWQEVEEFGCQRQEWLGQFLDLSKGVPSHDTIARVISLIDPMHFERIFFDWVESKQGNKSSSRICIDGKSIRGTERSFNRGRRPLHLVSAYCHDSGLVLDQQKPKGTGQAELSAALDCIERLNLEGTLLSTDAGLSSTKLTDKIRSKKGHYLIPIKGNRKAHLTEIEGAFSKFSKSKNADRFLKRAEQKEKSHGRQETRTCTILSAVHLSQSFNEDWQDVQTLIKIERKRSLKDNRWNIQTTGTDGKQSYVINKKKVRTTTQTVYWISSRKLNPTQGLERIREHWAIENKLHWVLDVVFLEDAWRVRQKNVAQNLSTVRKIAFNMLQQCTEKGSKKRKMKRAAWNTTYLEKLIFS
jgi:predicted transposase YbfD/YdcC